MTPTDPETPQTAAGRAFLVDYDPVDGLDDTVERAILAIEAEARAAGFAAGKAAGMIEGWQGIDEARAARDAEFARGLVAYNGGKRAIWTFPFTIDKARELVRAILSDTPETGS